MRDHGGIEEGGGFEGILSGEECADEELAFTGEGAMREEVMFDLFEVGDERGFDLEVATGELESDLVELVDDLFFSQCKGSADDGGHALAFGGNERADDDTGALWEQCHLMAAEVDLTHSERGVGGEVVTCSAWFISTRARWKARVDSAPWFSLTRS